MAKPAANDPNIVEIAGKAGIAKAFLAGVRAVIVPGTTLVFTEKRVNGETQSKPGLNILGVGEVAARQLAAVIFVNKVNVTPRR
jgi:hypothetical protein